ncbi:MAG: ATP synthase subunit C [Treponema sp.]|nr:ATP synthase subunit C [Treponema sp.]
MKRKLLLVCVLLLVCGTAVFAQEETAAGEAAISEAAPPASVWKYFAAALAVGISCIAGGMAVGRIGSAAMGAMSENPDLSGKALPYAGLAEGICLWGFLVALLMLFR